MSTLGFRKCCQCGRWFRPKPRNAYHQRFTATEPQHLYLPGPQHGVWNGMAAKTNQTLFVCATILDGLSLWQAGFKNVISLDSTNGWTADHTQLLKSNNLTEVFLCPGNDQASRTVTDRLKQDVLPALVKAVHVIAWPEGVQDANDFFLSRGPHDFEALLQVLKPQVPSVVSEHTTQTVAEQIMLTQDGFTAVYGSRRYELRAIEKPGAARLKATIRAMGDQGRFVIDTVDFYLLRSRRSFLSESARLFREPVTVIETDMNRLIEQLEQYVANRSTNLVSPVMLVSDTDKAEALKLGRHPDLVGEIQRDMERLGLMGEPVNKLISYLVMSLINCFSPCAVAHSIRTPWGISSRNMPGLQM